MDVRSRPDQLRRRAGLLALPAGHQSANAHLLLELLRQRCFDDIDLSVWTVGFDAMFRFPLLKSAQFPMGQLQPYITVGPAIFVAHAEDSHDFVPSHQSDSDTSVGVKVGAGVAWHFTKTIAMFGEYRYTHFSPEFTLVDNARGSTDLSTDVNTHYVLVGVSFHF